VAVPDRPLQARYFGTVTQLNEGALVQARFSRMVELPGPFHPPSVRGR